MYVVMYECLPLPRLLTLLPVDQSLFSSLSLELFFMFLLVLVILSLFFCFFFWLFFILSCCSSFFLPDIPISCLTFQFHYLFMYEGSSDQNVTEFKTAASLPRGCNLVPRVLGSKIPKFTGPNVPCLCRSFSNTAVPGQVLGLCLVWDHFFSCFNRQGIGPWPGKLAPEWHHFFAVPERTSRLRQEWGYHDQTKLTTMQTVI